MSAHISHIFQPRAADIIMLFLEFGIGYALLAKFILFTLDYFESDQIPGLSIPHYRCLLNNNKEIENHISEIRSRKLVLTRIGEKHSYEQNIAIIHRNLSDHLMECLREEKIDPKDIFLSVFHDDKCDINFDRITSYQYCSHFDPTLHSTQTSVLEIEKDKFRNFAGIKAIKRKEIVVCHKIAGDYVVGKEARRQSIKHYIGVPLKIGDKVVALLNIEFHNKVFFKTVDEMKSFYQKEIQAFVYLYEYQIHKKYFFNHLICEEVVA